MEDGRVICEAKIRKNNPMVIQYGKHRYLHQGVNDISIVNVPHDP